VPSSGVIGLLDASFFCSCLVAGLVGQVLPLGDFPGAGHFVLVGAGEFFQWVLLGRTFCLYGFAALADMMLVI